MRFKLFGGEGIGTIVDDEKFHIVLQQKQRTKNETIYGNVGEFELTGRELKQLLAMFDGLFSRPNELPSFPEIKEAIDENQKSKR